MSVEQCIAEQHNCADYIAGRMSADKVRYHGKQDKRGAVRGLEDWLMEEAILRDKLRAPFPWFGGKSRAAELIWDRFGNVPNYVEPFAGSLAVLFGRPFPWKVETVNDLDHHIVNVWRSIRWAPDETARWADWPVNEADMLARHRTMIAADEFKHRLRTDPEYYDVKYAGWWVWGCNIWIRTGWCAERRDGNPPTQVPHLGDAGKGIHRRLPHLGDAGKGIHRRLPHLGDAGKGEWIQGWFKRLSERLREVRVCCGEWDRVLGDSVTVKHGTTAVLLDPPYTDEQGYGMGEPGVAAKVREWAIENGHRHDIRIALCGYTDEHAMPEGWTVERWKARKGYQKVKTDGSHSGHQETIWFSPHCLKYPTLFSTDDLLEQGTMNDSTLECHDNA